MLPNLPRPRSRLMRKLCEKFWFVLVNLFHNGNSLFGKPENKLFKLTEIRTEVVFFFFFVFICVNISFAQFSFYSLLFWVLFFILLFAPANLNALKAFLFSPYPSWFSGLTYKFSVINLSYNWKYCCECLGFSPCSQLLCFTSSYSDRCWFYWGSLEEQLCFGFN